MFSGVNLTKSVAEADRARREYQEHTRKLRSEFAGWLYAQPEVVAANAEIAALPTVQDMLEVTSDERLEHRLRLAELRSGLALIEGRMEVCWNFACERVIAERKTLAVILTCEEDIWERVRKTTRGLYDKRFGRGAVSGKDE